MAWIKLDEADSAAFREIAKGSARSAAIVVGSVVDDRLKRAILARMHRDRNIEEKVFEGHGALATCSAKIDLGYLLHLYPRPIYNILRDIDTVRNAFAHSTGPRSFDFTSSIKRENIARLCDSIGMNAQSALNSAMHSYFRLAFAVGLKEHTFNTSNRRWRLRKTLTRRAKYIAGAQACVFVLALMTDVWQKESDLTGRHLG